MRKLIFLLVFVALPYANICAQSPVIVQFRQIIDERPTQFVSFQKELIQDNTEKGVKIFRSKIDDSSISQSYVTMTGGNAGVYAINYDIKGMDAMKLKIFRLIAQQYVNEMNQMVNSGKYKVRDYQKNGEATTEITDLSGNIVMQYISNSASELVLVYGVKPGSKLTVENFSADLKYVMDDANTGFSAIKGALKEDTKYYGLYYYANFSIFGAKSSNIYYTDEIYYKFTKVTIPKEYSFVQTFADSSKAGQFVNANIEKLLNDYAKRYGLKLKVTKDKYDGRKPDVNYIYQTRDGQKIVSYTTNPEEHLTKIRVYSNNKNNSEPDYLGSMILYKMGNGDSQIDSAEIFYVYGKSIDNETVLYNTLRSKFTGANSYTKYEWLAHQSPKQTVLHIEPLKIRYDSHDVNSDGSAK